MGWPIHVYLKKLSLSANRFYDWKKRYGRSNKSTVTQPKSHWLLADEVKAIENYALQHPGEGYRRLAYMMLDENVVATSPSSVYRVLKQADLLNRAHGQTRKGSGFQQPEKAHQHWHSDISYLNITGTFFYFISVLDGYSRYIINWEIRESMTAQDVEITIQRALEKYPNAKPRIISDNGTQYLSRDFRSFVRWHELQHVTTSPYYPQSNGKIERFHKTLKTDGIKHGDLLDIDTAKRRVADYVEYYNATRLHSAIGYVAPLIKLSGCEDKVFADRASKLAQAKHKRKKAHAILHENKDSETMFQLVKIG